MYNEITNGLNPQLGGLRKIKLRKKHKGMKRMNTISGYQVIDHKISELPLANRVYNTTIIEKKGLRFAATVLVNFEVGKGIDPFLEAQKRAINAALAESEKSDFQIFGRSFGGGGGFKSNGGGKPKKDPNAIASPGFIGSFFGKGIKDFGYKRFELQALISQLTGQEYVKDCENSLTNGQVETLMGQIERGERAGANVSKVSEATSKQGAQRPAAAQDGQNVDGKSDAQANFFAYLFKKMRFVDQADRDEYYAFYLQGRTKPESKADFAHLIKYFKVDIVKMGLARMGISEPSKQVAWVNEFLNKRYKMIEDVENTSYSEIRSLIQGLESQAAA